MNSLDGNVKRVVIEEGNVTEVIFSYNVFRDKEYVAKISNEEINVLDVINYNRYRDEATWYLDHDCGAQGFGMGAEDVCDACSFNGKTTDMGVAQRSSEVGHKAQDFLDVIKNDLPRYCLDIENFLNKKK
jgi:hypothetical protein